MRFRLKKYKHESLEDYTHGKFIKRIKMLVIILAIITVGTISIFLKNKFYKSDVSSVVNKQKYANLEQSGVTSIDLTGLVTGDDVNHVHIYEKKYDDEKHWEECFICNDIRNQENHTKVTDGSGGCGTYLITHCTKGCGYNVSTYVDHDIRVYTYDEKYKPDGSNTNKNTYYHMGGICTKCGTKNLKTNETCRDSEGNPITCSNRKVCVGCGFDWSTLNYVSHQSTSINSNNNYYCAFCGKEIYKVLWQNVSQDKQNNYHWTISGIFQLLNGVTWRNTNLPIYSPSFPTSSIAFSSLKNGTVTELSNEYYNKNEYGTTGITSGLYMVKYEAYFNEGFQGSAVVRLNADNCFGNVNGKSNEYAKTYALQVTISPDIIAPEIKEITVNKGEIVDNFSKKATITVNCTDNYSDVLDIAVYDSKGNCIAEYGSAAKNPDGSFTRTVDIVAEAKGDEILTIKAKDRYGNESQKQYTIQNIDSTAPTLTNSLEYIEPWTKTKDINFIAQDLGIGKVQIGFNNQDDYQTANQNENLYNRNYNFYGDVYDYVTGALYLKDGLGNERVVKVKIGKLDGTAPTIENVDKTVSSNKKEVGLNVVANDYCAKVRANGSGVTNYAITRDLTEPNTFQDTTNFTVTENGTYYLWAKDLVGNTSEPKEVVIDEIESILKVNPNGGIWKESNEIQTFTLKDKETKDIPNPTREGHVFSGWQIEGEGSTFANSQLTIGVNDITLTAQWEPWSTNISITKIDSETRRNLSGATFKLLEWNGSEYIEKGNLINNQDGTYTQKITYTDTNKGRFRVIEETAPEGYYGDWTDTTKTAKKVNEVTITEEDNGKIVTISNNGKGTYENKRVTGTIDVSKIDKEKGKFESQGDATLNNAEYGLYAAEQINHKDTITGKLYNKDELVQRRTIINGTLKFTKVEIGNYYIKEITAPEGYLLDETQYPVQMTYEGEGKETLEKSLIIEEQVIKQAFKIEKLSNNSSNIKGSPLAGAGFKIYLISELKKVKSGEITPDENGNYNSDDFINYDFSNEETAKYFAEEENGEKAEKRLVELFTDEEGHITTPELPYGKYVVIESTIPAERYEVEPTIVEIREDSREPQDYRYLIDKEFEALIKINKLDSSTGEKVLDKTAGYRIWDVKNEKYVEQKIADLDELTIGTAENPYRINDEGYIITPLELQIGEYELEEVEAPEGYVKQGYEGKIENGVESKTPKDKVKFKVTEKGVYYQDTDLGYLVINVNQYNDPMLGELKVTKEGKKLVGIEEKENGTIDFKYETKPIEGTKFEIYAKENIYTQDNQGELIYTKDELVGNIETNTRGIGYLNNLPIGKYYIKEMEAGEGFTLNKSIKEFEIKYQGEEKATEEVVVDYINERQKADVNDKRGLIIEKITDRVIYKPGEEVIYIIKVSNTGEVEASNIVVTENKVNGEFIDLDEEKVERESEKVVKVKKLEPGESIELKYKTQLGDLDEIDEKLEITNVVDAKGEVIVPDPDNPGEEKKDEVEAEDKNNIVVTDKQLVVVKEAVKDNYAPGEIVQYLVKVVNNGTEEIKNIEVKEELLEGRFVGIEEARKNGIDVEYKKDDNGEDNYNEVIINKIGAKETVTLKYEYTVPTNQEQLKIIGNTVKVKGIIEKENPDDPDHPIIEEVEDEDSKDIEIKEDDNGLGVIKKDITTGERISGAEIGLYAGEDIKTEEGIVLIEKDTLIEKTITNDQGKAIFTVNLPLGMYYVQELEAPIGYLLSTEKIDIDLRYRGQDQEEITVTHVLTNTRREAKIEKVDEEGKLLLGAELEVIDEEGNVIDTWITENESHIVDKLDKEKIYTLREINPVKGYTTANEIKFYIGEDEKLYQLIEDENKQEENSEEEQENNQEKDSEEEQENNQEIDEKSINSKMLDYITMKDSKTKIKIEVKDKDTGEIVPGIKVDIVDKTTGEVVDTVVTTEDGADIEGLPVGDYELRIEDPEDRGYVTDSEDITVEDTLEEQKYEIDANYTELEIGIKDEETGKLLPGGKIEVLDEEGNVVAEIETEEDMSKLDRLPPGKYTLHETEAPKGYWPSEDVEIEVKDTGEKQRFILTNRRKIFDMSVEKKLIKQVYNGVVTDITGNLSKFEIRPQNIGKAEFWTIYTVTVKNVGEIEGKATVKELIPDGFEMYQESNLAWKVEGNEATLTTDVIEPGKSLQYEVALRWKQSVLNIGMKENKVSLVSTENEFGFKDENEDGNNSSASILVALSTGLETHTEIVICIMLVVAILGTISFIIIKVSNKEIKFKK